MTIDEARRILEGAAWSREPHVAALFDDLVERHDRPAAPDKPGQITRQIAACKAAQGISVLVALVLNLRRKYPPYVIYEISDGD